jgi:Ca-activated chloride channel family protein
MTKRNVERMLADQPAPKPPEGLVERIKAEIPDRLELSPELTQGSSVVPLSRRRQLYLAAAALLVVALTATVTWQLRTTTMHKSPIAEVEPRSVLTEAPAPTPEPQPESVASRVNEQAAAVGGESVTREEESRPAGAVEQRSRVDVGDRAKLELVDRRQSDSIETDTAQPAAPAPTERRAPSDKDSVVDELRSVGKILGNKEQEEGARLAGRLPTPAPVAVTTDSATLSRPASPPRHPDVRQKLAEFAQTSPPSTGGTAEPNDAPYGDVFFRSYGVNPFVDTDDDNLSTFGLDVDTGSYSIVRRYLHDGYLPPHEAVRVEEIVNSFDYRDRPPGRGDFELTAEGAPSPFTEGDRYRLLRFAITAREVAAVDRPSALLVFVVDISGSMARENRLGLVKQALYRLLDNLRSDDRVGLVVYGSRGEVVLEPTTDLESIRSAIDRLHPAGSTNAEEGLVLGYQLAERSRGEHEIRRVILCSDGVANVGRTGPDSLLERIERSAEHGVELTTVGFGMGNYNDVLMERLADTGNGRYAYVDSLAEARRIFVEELTGTLMTVAREAKAQVEFHRDLVSRYRLLGYENRDIADDRFRDPTVDAGEIGAGHTVTALYEIKLHDSIDRATRAKDLATLRLRYRRPGDDQPVELEQRVGIRDLAPTWQEASPSLRLASLVAEYAEILKGAYWARTGDLDEVLRRAQELSPEYAGDSRVADFVSLVAKAADLSAHRDPGRQR